MLKTAVNIIFIPLQCNTIKAKKTTDAITCKEDNNIIFIIYAIAEAKRGVKGYDALAVYNNKLYVVDSKSCKVFIYSALTEITLIPLPEKVLKTGA